MGRGCFWLLCFDILPYPYPSRHPSFEGFTTIISIEYSRLANGDVLNRALTETRFNEDFGLADLSGFQRIFCVRLDCAPPALFICAVKGGANQCFRRHFAPCRQSRACY